jgi:hypothetical protein
MERGKREGGGESGEEKREEKVRGREGERKGLPQDAISTNLCHHISLHIPNYQIFDNNKN